MKKNQFDWSLYYKNLEEGNPANFPFWQWFTREMIVLIGHVMLGCVSGFALTFFIILSFPYWSQWVIKYEPNIKIMCEQYQKIPNN